MKLLLGWWSSSWALSLARSVLVMLAGPVRRKPKPISSVPKRTPPPPSPRQNVRRKS
nr:MAG TPA_asm: hypothetical protein [Bacteriophage sp.]